MMLATIETMSKELQKA